MLHVMHLAALCSYSCPPEEWFSGIWDSLAEISLRGPASSYSLPSAPGSSSESRYGLNMR